MSRSTKKPMWVQGSGQPHKKFAKRKASRAIRLKPESEAPAQGGAYRKESNPYDIADFKIYDGKSAKARRK